MHTQRNDDILTITIGGYRSYTHHDGASCTRDIVFSDKIIPIEQPESLRQVVFTLLNGEESRYRFIQREPGIYDMEPIGDPETMDVLILPAGKDTHNAL